jgi:hypothetical protein
MMWSLTEMRYWSMSQSMSYCLRATHIPTVKLSRVVAATKPCAVTSGYPLVVQASETRTPFFRLFGVFGTLNIPPGGINAMQDGPSLTEFDGWYLGRAVQWVRDPQKRKKEKRSTTGN